MTLRLLLTVTALSFIPSALIGYFSYRKFSTEKFNRGLFAKLLICGALAVIPGVIVIAFSTGAVGNGIFSRYLIKPFMAVALIEEILKLTVISLVLYRSRYFNTIEEGILYSIAVALGFAFGENIIYLTGSSAAWELILSRSLTAVPLHAICGAYMGFFTGLAKREEKKQTGKALFSAVLIHGIYNILINRAFPYYLLSLILLGSAVYFLKQLYSRKVQY